MAVNIQALFLGYWTTVQFPAATRFQIVTSERPLRYCDTGGAEVLAIASSDLMQNQREDEPHEIWIDQSDVRNLVSSGRCERTAHHRYGQHQMRSISGYVAVPVA